MKRRAGWLAAATAIIVALWPVPARAQIVATTFGPGDSYLSSAYPVFGGEAFAQGFTYGGGSGLHLAQIRLALWKSADPYTISFWHGSDLNTATSLEAWSRSVSADGIVSFASVVSPGFVTGDMYWIVAEDPTGVGYWNLNDQGITGVSSRNTASDPWVMRTGQFDWSAAYDVTATDAPVHVTPEPASALLLATGLAGLGGALRRRRTRSES